MEYDEDESSLAATVDEWRAMIIREGLEVYFPVDTNWHTDPCDHFDDTLVQAMAELATNLLAAAAMVMVCGGGRWWCCCCCLFFVCFCGGCFVFGAFVFGTVCLDCFAARFFPAW